SRRSLAQAMSSKARSALVGCQASMRLSTQALVCLAGTGSAAVATRLATHAMVHEKAPATSRDCLSRIGGFLSSMVGCGRRLTDKTNSNHAQFTKHLDYNGVRPQIVQGACDDALPTCLPDRSLFARGYKSNSGGRQTGGPRRRDHSQRHPLPRRLEQKLAARF